MKYFFLFLVVSLLYVGKVNAGCGSGQSQVVVTIYNPAPSQYKIYWSLYNPLTNVLIDTGASNSDTVCVSSSECLQFNIYSRLGNSICCYYGPGYYKVSLDGVTVASGDQNWGYVSSSFFNCPPGHDCTVAIQVGLDTVTAQAPETWYVFTPDSTGLYDFSTCGLGNTCRTKIFVYDHCTGIVPSGDQEGAMLYNGGAECDTTQAEATGILQAGHAYYIRIGQHDNSCVGQSITWSLKFLGLLHGCTDPAACNYFPLAGIDDSSCLYFPNSLCPQPDLVLVQSDLENSMQLDTIRIGQSDCYVSDGCASGYGVRQLIRFTTHIANVGNQDYYLGVPDSTNPKFVYDICHHHWHYVGYAEYLLFNSQQQEMQVSFKDGFCVIDLTCDSGVAKYTCSNMGITAGCSDIYETVIPCQWIDITDVDTGYYTFAVQVNWTHEPDELGHFEKRYDNNWAQVCLQLYYDSTGRKKFHIIHDCPLYVDCAGDTFGTEQRDCAGVCHGSNIMGDINADHVADIQDVGQYINGVVTETLPYTFCDDLNGDKAITVTDAAWLYGCILFNQGQNNGDDSRRHCQFPFEIDNQLDTVTFCIADADWQNKYVDLSAYNPSCRLLAYEFKIHGLVVDSVQNLATGNYQPQLYSSSLGHIAGMSFDNNPLYVQGAPLNFMRVYYSSLTDTVVYIDTVKSVVNSDYEEVVGLTGVDCVKKPLINSIAEVNFSASDVSIIPNPSSGSFDVYFANQSMYGAQINITDAVGRIIYESKEETLSNKLRIDLNNHSNGMYFMRIKLNGAEVTKRIMIVGE